MMPKLYGFAVGRQLRKLGIASPIMMLTAKGQMDDKVAGLDCGADDYLVKPFNHRELLARVRAMLRMLAERPGEVVTREEFLDRVWGYGSFPVTRTVEQGGWMLMSDTA
jgi:DNA-binding response OmpR family regulator